MTVLQAERYLIALTASILMGIIISRLVEPWAVFPLALLVGMCIGIITTKLLR